ncbi:MAG: DNA-binding protein [Desulfurococcales archaeon]|nr:DNA-binding protein [Desulfurococcales archaeon]
MSLGPDEDRELEELKKRKLLELRRRLEEEQRLREEQARLEAQREALLRSLLTHRARERLANVKLVKPELARAVEDTIIQLVQAGRLVPPVDDDVVKELLIAIDSRTRREPRVRFKWK